MKKNKLTVGQMAKLNHTTVATLKLYEKLGLLEPDFVDPDNGYRYYDVTQSTVFRAIRYNRNLSLSLDEIQEIVRQNSYDTAIGFYEKEMEQLEEKIRGLQDKLAMLQKTIGWLKHYQKLPPAGTITLEYLETQYVFSLPAVSNYFQEDYASYVYGIAKLTDYLEQEHIPCCYKYFTCITMTKGDFLAGRYRAREIGTYVNQIYASYPHVALQEGQLYVCAYVDDFAKLPDQLDALHSYCGEHGCMIQGDVICRLLGSINPRKLREPAPFLRLQIPVSLQAQAK